jgi:hypothetical protein
MEKITKEVYDAALARGKHAQHLAKGAKRLKCLRLIPDHYENQSEYLSSKSYKDTMNLKDHYVLLGEVANTDHYILLNISTGCIVPGMLHLDRFEEIPEDDL